MACTSFASTSTVSFCPVKARNGVGMLTEIAIREDLKL
jgi:hypothetical protein